MIILHTPHLLFLHFFTPCVVHSLNVEEGNIFLLISGLSLAFDDFLLSNIFYTVIF